MHHDCLNGLWYRNLHDEIEVDGPNDNALPWLSWARTRGYAVYTAAVELEATLRTALGAVPFTPANYESALENPGNLASCLTAAKQALDADAAAPNAHADPAAPGWLLRPTDAPNGFPVRVMEMLLLRVQNGLSSAERQAKAAAPEGGGRRRTRRA